MAARNKFRPLNNNALNNGKRLNMVRRTTSCMIAHHVPVNLRLLRFQNLLQKKNLRHRFNRLVSGTIRAHRLSNKGI